MASTATFRKICIALAIFGMITTGICIWLVAFPVKGDIPEILNESGPISLGISPKIGLAAGCLMILTGIAACFVDLDEYIRHFLFPLIIMMILTIISFAFAVKNHEDIQEGRLRINVAKADNPAMRSFDKFLYDIIIRYVVLAAVTSIDSVIESFAFVVVFLVKRD